MKELTWFSLALIAVTFWGMSDVFFKKGTDEEDRYSHLRIIIMIGLVMGIQALFELQKMNWNYDIKTIVTYFPVSFLYILSMTIDFYGYRYLKISVGSPVASTSGAIAGLLSFRVLGKAITKMQFTAVVLITLGLIFLTLLEKKEAEKDEGSKIGAKALIFPGLYAIIDALGTFLDDVYLSKFLSPEEALISFELTFFIAAVLALFYIVYVKNQNYKIKEEKYNIYGAICETAGQFFYVYALSGNSVVAAPLMSLDGIMAAIIGRFYLKEKLSKKQYITIMFIGVGVFILGFFE